MIYKCTHKKYSRIGNDRHYTSGRCPAIFFRKEEFNEHHARCKIDELEYGYLKKEKKCSASGTYCYETVRADADIPIPSIEHD